MKRGALAACVSVTVLLSASCAAATRYRVLTFLFDGVPPPSATAAAGPAGGAAGPAVSAGAVRPRDHGPYEARMCDACHKAGTNALVAPKDELCFRCHELRVDRRYIHGPIASGGCLVCHDPHSSPYRSLLVSESDSFCFHCHDRAAVAAVAGHEGVESGCTGCHDAHASDTKFLLK